MMPIFGVFPSGNFPQEKYFPRAINFFWNVFKSVGVSVCLSMYNFTFQTLPPVLMLLYHKFVVDTLIIY